jgi:hypothetical protein
LVLGHLPAVQGVLRAGDGSPFLVGLFRPPSWSREPASAADSTRPTWGVILPVLSDPGDEPDGFDEAPTSLLDRWSATLLHAFFIPIVIALLSGALVLATAFVWHELGQQELGWQSILVTWPIAAIVFAATFVPIFMLADRRRGPPVERRPGEPPPVVSDPTMTSVAAQQAPFWLAVGATVLAILILWTSIIR